MPRPRQPRLPDLDARSAAEVAPILGLTYPSQFNKERERRQLVLDPLEGLMPYPPNFRVPNPSPELRAEQREFDRTHHLVVIEWGGTKAPGRSWSYSLRQCQDIQARGLAAELDARQHWGLPTVSSALGGGRRRRKRQRARADRESATNAA